MMPVTEILTLPALSAAVVVQNTLKPSSCIDSVIIAPSLNIAKWGNDHTIVLLPPSLVENRTSIELTDFFVSARKIGVPLFLSPQVPQMAILVRLFTELFQHDAAAYILTNKDLSFSQLLLDIQRLVFDYFQKKYLFSRKCHFDFSRFSLQNPTYIESLQFIKEKTGFPISLKRERQKKWWSTDPDYNQFQVLQTTLLSQHAEQSFLPELRVIQYGILPHHTSSHIHLPFPQMNGNEYALILHTRDKMPDDQEWMIIEQAFFFLQNCILKKEAVKLTELQYKNDFLTQLLKGHSLSETERIEQGARFNLSDPNRYIVVICDFLEKGISSGSSSYIAAHIDRFLMNAKLIFRHLVFVQKPTRLIFILDDLNEFSMKRKLHRLLNETFGDVTRSSIAVRISMSPADSVKNIPKNYEIASAIQRVMDLLKEENTVFSFDDIGIYKFFIHNENLEQFKEAIPPPVLELNEKEPELLQTLKVFLAQTQNYKKTAELLFVHPKTVRYRMEKIKEEYKLDLDDPNVTLQLQLSLQLIAFLSSENK